MNCDIARVYLIDVPYSLDKLYDYYIPPELSKKAVRGALVSVPFGAGNRRMSAVVRTVADSSALEDIKPVLSVQESFPCLDDEQLELCEFLKEYTLCTVGEAVRSIVPSAAFSKINEYIVINPKKEYDVSSRKLSERAVEILGFVKSSEKVSVGKLRALFGDDAASCIGQLVKNKYVLRASDITDGARVKTETSVSLLIGAAEALAIADGVPGEKKIRSVLQREALRALAVSGTQTSRELGEKTGCSALHISALEKKGLVKCEKKEVFRNPYSDAAPEREEITLSQSQKKAFDTLKDIYAKDGPRGALLYGVTGSGKTSVIKKMIDSVRAEGRGVIMLVPEIALTPQAVSVFCGYYGESVSVLHSGLSNGERFDAWRRIRDGLCDIVIGTRSAVFAPLKNIGLIVIDEEQEHTYKSDTDPKYSAHDVARYRCKVHGSMLLLASATPSVSSFYRAKSGKYTLVEMKDRYGGAVLPEVKICDMRRESAAGNTSPFSMELIARLSDTVQRGRQAIIFLNRRGYNNTVSCMSCGEAIKCPHCSVSMTFHTRYAEGPSDDETRQSEAGHLICHYCGYTTRVPSECPTCGKKHFRYMGCGTQRAEEEIVRLVPGAKISRMDTDTTSKKSSHEKIINEFRSGETNILLGTQMVAKGHDFPNVELVGVLGADLSLYLDDYRAGERTFSMLTQVVGRAGRREATQGVSVVQTLNPNSDVIRLAAEQNYNAFYENEIRFRHNLAFPPFCDIALLTLSSADEALLSAASVRLYERLRELLGGEWRDIELQAFGPFKNPVYKVRNVCRMRMVLKCRATRRLREMLSLLLCEFGRNAKNKVSLSVDFNPSSL